MSAWVLPDHIADVLPSEARHIEELRRELIDAARRYGYELVIPPLVEHLESLLSGAGEALDLQTFKLVDQLSGRMLGVRADMTPQAARIDAHLLNRSGVTRLCYCGPVMHTRPDRPHATREPLQFGAELYGHQGLEADLEILLLAIECLQSARLEGLSVDLADARIVRALLDAAGADAARRRAIHAALSTKDAGGLAAQTAAFAAPVRDGLRALADLYGGPEVLTRARLVLPADPRIDQALGELAWMGSHLRGARVTYDLADLRGYAYYSGMRFSIFATGARDALARGGRYDEVGAVFGRTRPAVGFSLDLKALVASVPARPLHTAIRAPWGDSADLTQAVAALRREGHTVVCVLPGHEHEVDEFACDRELVQAGGRWVVQAL